MASAFRGFLIVLAARQAKHTGFFITAVDDASVAIVALKETTTLIPVDLIAHDNVKDYKGLTTK